MIEYVEVQKIVIYLWLCDGEFLQDQTIDC